MAGEKHLSSAVEAAALWKGRGRPEEAEGAPVADVTDVDVTDLQEWMEFCCGKASEIEIWSPNISNAR